MENNNKYLQTVAIVNKTVFEDEDGNTKYNYGVFAKVWNKEEKRFRLKDFLITSVNDYDINHDTIKIKSNKNNTTGEIYFTEYQETPFDI